MMGLLGICLFLTLTLNVVRLMAFTPIPLATRTSVRFSLLEVRENVGVGNEDQDIVARRIIVTGSVQGGYYRSCVLNEVSTAAFSLWQVTCNLLT